MKIDESVRKAILHCVGGEGCNNCPYEFMDGCTAIEPLLYDINQLSIENTRLEHELHNKRDYIDELAKCKSELTEENSNLRDTIACLRVDGEVARRSLLETIKLWFSTRFGTYTKDDTIKVTEVFDILKEITERLTEGTNDYE